MSDEQFLARWSRRKQEAKADHVEPALEQAAEAHGPTSPERAAAEPVAAETDLSKLPPIESIDAASDITAFLREGVPQELSRAALRRAWSADPAIRDFVGLAENAWDFNDPNAMPGFGPLDYSAEQVDALVRRVGGGVVETAEGLPNALAEATEDLAELTPAEAGFAQFSGPAREITSPQLRDESAPAQLPTNSAASQPEAEADKTPVPRRTHGGALPQ